MIKQVFQTTCTDLRILVFNLVGGTIFRIDRITHEMGDRYERQTKLPDKSFGSSCGCDHQPRWIGLVFHSRYAYISPGSCTGLLANSGLAEHHPRGTGAGSAWRRKRRCSRSRTRSKGSPASGRRRAVPRSAPAWRWGPTARPFTTWPLSPRV